MGRVEKTVFISYRRTDFPWAAAIFQDLNHNGYDVFYDIKAIASGSFESVILGNIDARAHFLVLLTPSALERCSTRETGCAAKSRLLLEASAISCHACWKALTLAHLESPISSPVS